MRKVTLTVIGILGLSLLLCGTGEVLAQTDTSAFPPGSPGSDATDSRIQGMPSINVDAGTPGTASSGTQTSAGTTGTTGTEGAGAVATGAGQTAGGAEASSADLQQYVLQLQGEVARLRQELAQVRAELANVTERSTGAGGSGQAGVGGSGQTLGAPASAPPSASAGQNTAAGGASGQGAVPGGTTGQIIAPQRSTNPDTAQRGTQAGAPDASSLAVAHAIFTGKVRSVSDQELVLQDDHGKPFTVELGTQTRFISKGQRISAQQLKQGTRVRATVDMLSGHKQAMEVTTLPER